MLLGILNLGAENYKDALASFNAAETSGMQFKWYHAATLAVERDFAGAEKLLPAIPAKFDADLASGTFNELLRITLPLARGDWPGGLAAIERARGIEGDNPTFRSALIDVELGVFGAHASDNVSRIAAALAAARATFKSDDVVSARTPAGHILLLSYLAARAGAIAPAEAAVADIDKRMTLSDSPLLATLDAVAKAGIRLAKDDAPGARALLQPLLDGSELCIVHVVLMDAYRREGNDKQALEHARWLGTHRGRAYAEYNLDKTLLPFNVVQSNLAWLNAAELSLKLGDPESARRDLAVFKKDWIEAGQPPALIARVNALQESLAPPPKSP